MDGFLLLGRPVAVLMVYITYSCDAILVKKISLLGYGIGGTV